MYSHEDLVHESFPKPNSVNIPVRSEQPDVSIDHPDFDEQNESYFNQKMINTPMRK